MHTAAGASARVLMRTHYAYYVRNRTLAAGCLAAAGGGPWAQAQRRACLFPARRGAAGGVCLYTAASLASPPRWFIAA